MAMEMRGRTKRVHHEEDGETPSEKRRLNGFANGNGSHNFQAADSEHILLAQESVRVLPSHAKADNIPEFSPGAIIAMRLINFQVASDSTFNFGPFLNLIIGTNGTGKSTIVNAIYLLFRGSLEAIDRRRYDEFIQYDTPYAVISAQLKGNKGESNPVVALKVKRGSAAVGRLAPRPQWYIDAQPCSEDEVDKLISAFHIQVNNLCQFLPQFRVAAFSGETAQQRLISTERAIGYDGMVEDHQSISNASEELFLLSTDVERLRSQAQAADEKRVLLRAKAAQLEAANQDKRHMELLGHVLKIAKFRESQAEADNLKAQLECAKRKLEEVNLGQDDIRTKIAAANAQALESQESIQSIKRESAHKKSQHDSLLNSIASSQKLVQKHVAWVKSLTTEIKTAKDNLERLDNELSVAKLSETEIRKQLNQTGRDTESYRLLKRQLEELETSYVSLEATTRSVSDRQSAAERQVTLLQGQLRAHELKLEKLMSNQNKMRSAHQGREFIKGDNGNLERSVSFVESLQNKFERPVIMPALLSLNISDADILPILAEQLSFVHLQKFVCQTVGDQKLLTKLAAQNGLDIKNTYVAPESAGKRDQDAQFLAQMKEHGFTGLISDYMDGPEPVLRLMKSLGVNRVAYRSGVISAQDRESIKQSISSSKIEFADSQSFYRVLRSRYGKKSQTETIKALTLEPPKWAKFLLKNDNSAEIASTQVLKEKVKEQIAFKQNDINELIQTKAKIQPQLAHTLDSLKTTKAQLGDEDQLRGRLDKFRRKVQDTLERIDQFKSAQESRQIKLKSLTKHLKQNLSEYTEALSAVPGSLLRELLSFNFVKSTMETQATDAKYEASFFHKAIQADRFPYEIQVSQLQKRLETAQRLHNDYQLDNDASISWLRSHKKLKEGMREADAMTVAEIEDKMSRLNATVSLHSQRTDNLGNVNLQLETAEEGYQRASEELARKTLRMQDLSQSTGTSRRHWEAQLNSMIEQVSAKFSNIFSTLGCRGSVTIDRPDSVAVGTWGVDINLAFRQEETTLSKLTRFRQSGGERAVATAVYLLALQDLATAPFRVLDEINQGMDEKNERTTMKFFVQTACEPNRVTGLAQQTFLITPKLISDLPVHRNLSVTFIYGGPSLGNTDKLLATSRSDQVIQILRKERQQLEEVRC